VRSRCATAARRAHHHQRDGRRHASRPIIPIRRWKEPGELKRRGAKQGCDLGIAFDGDGDRIGVVDGQGRVLWGDQLMVILAADVLKPSIPAPPSSPT
jgi:phosphomannomutase